ncbi:MULTISPECIES: ASCH domain-containing protein [unclassified Amycolatopsis]|uniref:ASCH domain-containing protein n=1 Tax=unclassified Amycolatopsis TaxID=2618356 RepID=UPI0028741A58|nr:MULTISPECIES: ASCH domain-containing protein [unclassified Amycolatopsis]MDS0137638.1 ASCH domain-containing protein [Amycolatopsis sp. 505]MDS0141833.1 ASCH domain-containing protein [Amycolatopsis sp. CM201R]
MKHAEFAFPGPLRDKLVAAILAGEKTTTSALLAEYEHDGEALPFVGERELVLDSAGTGVAVIETVEVRVLPLSAVDIEHALGEGEGFASVAEWRAEHTKFWQSAEVRAALENPEFTVDDTTQVVATRFVIVERIG